MIRMIWDEYELIECLSVLPQVDDGGVGHHFTVRRDGLRLLLSVYQYEAEGWVSLFRDDATAALLSFRLTECSLIRLVKNRTSPDWLEIVVGQVAGEHADPGPFLSSVKISVDPDFRIDIL